MSDISRRSFVKGAATAAASTATVSIMTSKNSWAGANDRIRMAVIGIRGRGGSHINGFSAQKNVEVVALCDVDERLFAGRIKKDFEGKGRAIPKTCTDMRALFDDDSIDAVSIATPNHWHSLATVWACQAGKDVYVEKPGSHNIFEGRKMVEAAEKYGRIVQHGTQIRSSVGIQEAIRKLREGVIGEVYMARGLCYRWRDSIGKKPDSRPPKGVDYDMWLGPAPKRAFSENRFHYNWHFHWDYGNGDIGNQGVHQLDVARWGLGVELPSSVTSMGNMYLFDDDKEVPNVITTAYDYPHAGERGKMLVFDVRPWCTNDEKNAKVGVIFYGSEGYMVIDSYQHYRTYLGRKEERGPERDEGGDHFANFIEAVRSRDARILHAPIIESHLSSALAHLGLTSARLKRTLTFDPEKEDYVADAEASAFISRDYRAPYVVPAVV